MVLRNFCCLFAIGSASLSMLLQVPGSVAHPLTRSTFIKEALNASERKINEGPFTTNDIAHAGNHIKLKHKVSQGWT